MSRSVKIRKAHVSQAAPNGPTDCAGTEHDQELRGHDTYAKERENLCRSSLEVSGRYDQWIIALPSGALALSLGFLEKIAPHPDPSTRIWIGIAWTLLILALLSGLGAIFSSQYATDRQIKLLDERYRCSQNGTEEPKEVNHWTTGVHVLNWASIATLMLGVIFLCVFAFKNLPRGPAPAGKSIVPPNAQMLSNTVSMPATNKP